MAIDIKVPSLGESITEATVGQWFKTTGDAVAADEPLVELETDKVTVEVNAPSGGVLAGITAKAGETVEVGALLGNITEGAAPNAPQPEIQPTAEIHASAETQASAAAVSDIPLSPAVRKKVTEAKIDPAAIPGSGKNGRILSQDVDDFSQNIAPAPPSAGAPAGAPSALGKARPASPQDDAAREERIPMSRLRQTVAQRLKDAQNIAAMLTTFNEVDMSHVMALRRAYKDEFAQKYGVKLGFMGFFVKACVTALKEIPAVNGEIDGTDIVYKNYYHLGIAVGTDKGLVVPVIKDADQLSLAAIEQTIRDYAGKARDGKLGLQDLLGGTFTISNGGVYGSMMSTPILNAPQSGILGMHNIQDRAVVIDGGIQVRPMMYLALTYDHRIVDGRDAVTFLLRVKQVIEDPERLLLEV